MRNWRPFSLLVVALAALVVWHLLPVPVAKGQEMMKLPPGVSVKEKAFDTMGLSGVKKVTFNRLEMKTGAKWANVDMSAMNNGAKVWDFCYVLQGTFTVTGADGKTNKIPAGTSFTIPAGEKIPLITNKGKVTAVDIFWEIVIP